MRLKRSSASSGRQPDMRNPDTDPLYRAMIEDGIILPEPEHQEEPDTLPRWAIIAVLGTICVSALGVGIVLSGGN